jgi:3-hydroxyacyl-CoA dehydrogenase/3a,7a,12a-trihydroxy-5b-cholest-24-enoyl-CoA hydratase
LEIAPKVANVYLFKLSNPSSSWTMDLKNGAGSVAEGEVGKPDCTLEMSDADFLAMATGKANPMKLFTSGKLKIGGNVMASQKLDAVLKGVDPKEAQAAVEKARASGAKAAPAAASTAGSTKTAAASNVFAKLSERLRSKPELAGELGVVVQFAISDPESKWFVSGTEVSAGKAEKPAATITIKDDDLAALASGKQSAQSLYQHGQLRIDGDISVGHRLGVLKGLL